MESDDRGSDFGDEENDIRCQVQKVAAEPDDTDSDGQDTAANGSGQTPVLQPAASQPSHLRDRHKGPYSIPPYTE